MPELDGVRGLAIGLVTCYRFAKEIPFDSAVGAVLKPIFQFGDRGVDLFFVLSGFLITGILLDTRSQPGYLKNFFARRSLRIFPLYFLSLALFLTVGYQLQPAAFAQALADQSYLWTYTTNIKMSLEGSWCFGRLDHFWSLAVEEHFYFIWPFVVWFMSLKGAIRLTIVLMLLSGLGRMVFAASSDNGVAPDVLTIFRCDALLMGALVAMVARTPNGLQRLRSWAPWMIAVALLVGVSGAILQKRLWTLPHSLWPLLWTGMLLVVLASRREGSLAKLFALRPLTSLGKYSYAMYVFQNPLIPLTAAWLSASQLEELLGVSWLAELVYLASMFALTYLIAVVSWYAFEVHVLAWKRFFS